MLLVIAGCVALLGDEFSTVSDHLPVGTPAYGLASLPYAINAPGSPR